MKIVPPFKGPYLTEMLERQNACCLPIDRSPKEIVHVLKSKPLKGEKGEELTFLPDLSDKDGSLESESHPPCMHLALERCTLGVNPLGLIPNYQSQAYRTLTKNHWQ